MLLPNCVYPTEQDALYMVLAYANSIGINDARLINDYGLTRPTLGKIRKRTKTIRRDIYRYYLACIVLALNKRRRMAMLVGSANEIREIAAVLLDVALVSNGIATDSEIANKECKNV